MHRGRGEIDERRATAVEALDHAPHRGKGKRAVVLGGEDARPRIEDLQRLGPSVDLEVQVIRHRVGEHAEQPLEELGRFEHHALHRAEALLP